MTLDIRPHDTLRHDIITKVKKMTETLSREEVEDK
jgi:hypothetical protein